MFCCRGTDPDVKLQLFSPVLTKTKYVSKNLRNFRENPLSFSLVAKRVQTNRQDDFNSRSAGMQQRLRIELSFVVVLHRTKWSSSHLRTEKVCGRTSEVVRGFKMKVKHHWTEGVCGRESTAVATTAAATAIEY